MFISKSQWDALINELSGIRKAIEIRENPIKKSQPHKQIKTSEPVPITEDYISRKILKTLSLKTFKSGRVISRLVGIERSAVYRRLGYFVTSGYVTKKPNKIGYLLTLKGKEYAAKL